MSRPGIEIYVLTDNAYSTTCANTCTMIIYCKPEVKKKKTGDNLQFPKFEGHRLVLFEVILTGVILIGVKFKYLITYSTF